MIARAVIQTTPWLAAIGAIPVLATGDWLWPQGWVFLGELGLSSFAVSFRLLHRDQALLESRLSAPVRRDQMPWDHIVMLATVVVGWMVPIGLDARRFEWSHVPLWAQAPGPVLIALSMVLVGQTSRPPRCASRPRALQVTDGPYRIVRHPRYADAVLYFLGMPLLLGSWWGVAAVPLLALAWRRGPSGRSGCCATNSSATTSTLVL